MKFHNTSSNIPVPVAIIGMGCFFPCSSGLKPYWRLISQGKDAVSEVPSSHWLAEDFYDEDPKRPDHVYCKRGGFLSPVSFDPTEFAIPPSSLEATDTSQLLSLVAAKAALEDAGYGEGVTFNRDKTSVIIGVTGTQELVIPLGARLGHPKWKKALEASGVDAGTAEEVIKRISDSYVPWQENSFPGLLGNVVAGRICNRLDFGGTNCVVDAACASSMSAINLALLELEAHRSDMVVAGGVDAINDIFMHMCFSRTQILSPTGDARPFSGKADGTVLGEGLGLLILKRLEDAERDGDRIYSVIKAMGASSDGKAQSIYAPRREGQAKALKRAYRAAAVDPASVELVEAHGTGTRVGDAVEFSALNDVLGQSREPGDRCAIGSVKSMIGHTKAAAGAAGLIKTVLALHNKVLPPTLKADDPDPKLNMEKTPFYLNSTTRPWISKNGHPRRAGVSAFGFGGSNYHMVLEEYQKEKTGISWDGSVEIAAFSAPDLMALTDQMVKMSDTLVRAAAPSQWAYHLARSRERFQPEAPCRLLLALEMPWDRPPDWKAELKRAADALQQNNADPSSRHANIFIGGPDRPGKLAFVFPGQGSQYLHMGQDLACVFPAAIEMLKLADGALGDSIRLSDAIYPTSGRSGRNGTPDEHILRQTENAQPAIGTVSLAMLEILKQFGVMPDAVCGHSYGELTALYVAGCMDKKTFVRLSVERGRLMAGAGKKSDAENSGMLAVKGPLADIENVISNINGIVLANRNTPDQGVVSGPITAIEEAEQLFRKTGFGTVRLPVSAAFHSRHVRGAQEPFRNLLDRVDLGQPKIPVYANTTAAPYPDDPEGLRRLLGKQMVNPVNFVDQIENMFDAGVTTFVEVGPKTVLTGLIRSILRDKPATAVAIDGSGGMGTGMLDLARTLCSLAAYGYPVQLDHWEKTGMKPVKQKMSIPICGANYRSPHTRAATSSTAEKDRKGQPRQMADRTVQAPEDHRKNRSPRIRIPAPESRRDIQTPSPHEKDRKQMKKNDNRSQSAVKALQVIQEGLKSMQALQQQTAEAHKQFLESQTEASRTLRHLMEQAGQLPGMNASTTEHPLPLNTPVTPPPLPQGTGTHREENLPSPNRKKTEPFEGQAENGVESTFTKAPVDTGIPVAPSGQSPAGEPGEIESVLLAVVSELTGYPVEMLSAEMDIETDLGIDSIKRVEILSNLEEKMPHLPPVSPEVMGDLKTLGQIVEYMAGNTGQPAAVQVPPTQGPTSHSESGDTASTASTLLTVVSELTGYPEEMLSMEMDIETDLGIDSIKRVEILSTLEEKMPHLPPVSPEVMGDLKTLGQIVDYLGGEQEDPATAATTKAAQTGGNQAVPDGEGSDPGRTPDPPKRAGTVMENSVDRKVISMIPAPLEKIALSAAAPAGKILVTDDKTGLSLAIVDHLAGRGIKAELMSDEAVVRIIDGTASPENIAGLIINPDLSTPEPALELKNAFLLAKHTGPALMKTAETDTALFATITRLDGGFGFKGHQLKHAEMGGLSGLAKTAALEWQDVACRALDIDPEWRDTETQADAIVRELLHAGASAPLEVGMDSTSRVIPSMENREYPQGDIDLGSDDVVVISGGARGITAAIARHLAQRTRSQLVLLGRSPLPVPEPDWLVEAQDEPSVKRAIIEREFEGKAHPKAIEASFKRHMANREVLKNIRDIEQTGTRVGYRSVDVRDRTAIEKTIKEIRRQCGPITCLIHAAGTIEDRLIVDKTVDQFERVFDTKVAGLKNLLAATTHDPLRYLVFFSSVSARFGNTGQVDYAMANEVLNKIAQQESNERRGCRVISLNWGPWDGGMVSPSLRRAFERKNIPLIPIDAGAESLLREMAGDKSCPVEVVIGGAIVPKVSTLVEKPRQTEPQMDLHLTVKKVIDVDGHPILGAHVLDGNPVVPVALMAEWLGHGALHGNPGLMLHGLDDLRVLSGIKMDRIKKNIRLMAGKPVRNGSDFEVVVEIRDGIKKDGTDRIHTRAKAILTEKFSEPPHFDDYGAIAVKPYTRRIDDVYDTILFHGADLHGISRILGYSDKGMVARVSAAPSPEKWIKEPLRSRWIADPLVLDSAFQMAIIWCFEEKGMVSLPSYSASYRQYAERFPKNGVTAVLEVAKADAHRMQGNFTFIDETHRVVARIKGYEAIMDPSLSKAFRRRHAA